MPVELLLLLFTWAAILSLIVTLPWVAIRLAVGVLEADVSKPGADHENAQPRNTSEATPETPLSQEIDEPVAPIDTVPAATTPDENTDR